MKKIFLFFCALFALTACSSTSDSTTTNESKENIENKGVSLKDDIAQNIAKEVIEQLIMAPYQTQVGNYDLSDDNVSFNESEIEEIVQLKNEIVREFATQSFIDSNISLNDFNCKERCDSELPYDLHYAWKPHVDKLTNTSFQSKALITKYNEKLNDFDSYEQTVNFILEDRQWKVDGLRFEQKDMNIQRNEIEDYLSRFGFVDIEVTDEEGFYDYNGRVEKTNYFIDHDKHEYYLLFPRSGTYLFISTTLEGEQNNSRDLSINNEEDYISYNLFGYYEIAKTLINVKDPTYRNFVYELDQLLGAATTAYDFAEENVLQEIIKEAKILSTDIYTYSSKDWTEEQHSYFKENEQIWDQHYTTYFTKMLPEDTPQYERLYEEARALIYKSYVLLSEQSN